MRYPKFRVSDIPGLYILDSTVMSEGGILAMARQLSHDGMAKGRFLVMPGPTKDYLQNLMQHYEHEVFAVILLDACQADIETTKRLKDALALVDVRVVDHIVVGRDGCTSLAEIGHRPHEGPV